MLLYGYDGKCKNVHGHSYELSVTVIGNPISDTQSCKIWNGDRLWGFKENRKSRDRRCI